MNCPICNNPAEQFLYRSQVPVHQNLPLSTFAAARNVRRGDLNLCVCGNCGFIFNASFDPGLLEYGASYDNTQTCSPLFLDYINELVDRIIIKANVRNRRIVEVGCGKGDFLRRLVQDPNNGNTGFGFDPSYTGPGRLLNGRLKFVTDYYSSKFKTIKSDVVVCRHVIEHISDPIAILRDLRSCLNSEKDALLFFETPDVNWILSKEVIWDFFYEHCSYFNPHSITTAFNRAGFRVIDIHSTFGSQYMWIEAKPLETPYAFSAPYTKSASMAQSFTKALSAQQQAWTDRIASLLQKGPIAIWGAGAKGVTFANMIDPNCSIIDCVIDINPNKQGKFIPGTGHPIISIKNIAERNIQNAILMNPNYLEENKAILASIGLKLNLII